MGGLSWETPQARPGPSWEAMEFEDDAMGAFTSKEESVTSMSQARLGKRKNTARDEGCVESSEVEEAIRNVKRRSKSSRRRITSDKEEIPSQRITRAKGKAGESLKMAPAERAEPSKGSKFFADSDTVSCSETDGTVTMSGSKTNARHFKRDETTGKFVSKSQKKKIVGEAKIEDLLRPLPEELEELEVAPATQAIAFAIEWLEDIDLVRGRSAY